MTDDLLSHQPRVALGHWPTPLQPLRRLQANVGGPLIWLKRDDCSGLATGGNKTRKLEFLLGDAIDQRVAAVLTFGALQSNHCRQTAAACAAIGLPCHLVLTTAVDRHDDHYTRSGNVLLDGLFGATVQIAADGDAAIDAVVAAEAATDGVLYSIPPGGSNSVGSLGYVAAAHELHSQLVDAEVAADRIIVATSTGGTAAGLTVGMGQIASRLSVEAVCVYDSAAATGAAIESLVADTAERLAVDAPAVGAVTDHELGPGYGIVTPSTTEAIELLARTEGVLLDPVYTGKAFADVLRRIGSGELADQGCTDLVFVHTGGTVGLFAYTETLSP